MNRQVERVDAPNTTEKPVEFTHIFFRPDHNEGGWRETSATPSQYQRVLYLGCDKYDGDMFAAYLETAAIVIFKGHLNSGMY